MLESLGSNCIQEGQPAISLNTLIDRSGVQRRAAAPTAQASCVASGPDRKTTIAFAMSMTAAMT